MFFVCADSFGDGVSREFVVGHDCYKIFLFHIYDFYRVDYFGDSGFCGNDIGSSGPPLCHFSGFWLQLRSFGLALLFSLILVFRRGLIFLERFGHMLCSLICQSVIVDCLLCL